MIKNFTLKRKGTGIKIISFLTLIFSLAALQSMGQQVWEFDYTGSAQSIELPPGPYLLEVWGAQGGSAAAIGGAPAEGGKGGYSKGVIELASAQTIQVYVGEAGESNGNGSFNGGGMAGSQYGAEGGGASDIRISPHDLASRIIVAGGGGGVAFGSWPGDGGAGGGATGIAAPDGNGYIGGSGGTQIAGGDAGCCHQTTAPGTLGLGGGTGSYHNAGGGGGYYGGGSGSGHAGAGGGSGYVGPLSESQMLAGIESMPNPEGGSMTGVTGHGYARITLLYSVSQLSLNNATCRESEDGSITAEVSGGVAPYTFEWSNGDTNVLPDINAVDQISNLTPGEYTLDVTDVNGTVASTSFTVGPDPIEVSFDMTQTNSCDDNGDGALTANVTGGTAPYTYAWNSGETDAAISNKAFGEYTVTVTDANDCASVEGTESVTVNDNVAPEALVQDIEVFLDATGAASIVAQDIDNGSTDDCAIASMSIDVSEFSCADASAGAGIVVTRLSVTDAGGNVAEADANVTVNDTISPIAEARSHSLELDANGQVTADAEDFDDGSTDNCEVGSFSLDKSEFSCEDLGSNNIVLTVTDIHGNTKSKATQVEIVDEIAPVLALENLEVSLEEDGQVTISHTDLGSSTDNCAVASRSISIDTFTCEDLGEEVEVVYTAVDQSGNETQQSVTVTIVDNVAPIVEESQALTLYLDENGLGSFDSAPLIEGSTDNCSVERILGYEEGQYFDIDGTPFDCTVLGFNPGFILYAEDGSENKAQFSIDFTVLDTVKPIIQEEQWIVVFLDENGQATVDPDTLDVIATDNCGVASRSLSQTEFSCEDMGIAFMTFSVTDASGNSREQMLEVEVVDFIAPIVPESVDMTIYLDENGQGSFNEESILVQSSDNCTLDGVYAEFKLGTFVPAEELLNYNCESVGNSTRTLHVLDQFGNPTPFVLNLVVEDTISPTFNLNQIELFIDNEGNASINEGMLAQYAADNCGVAEVAIQTEQFDCSQVGETQFTEIIVFDLHGNSVQQTLEVQLIDNMAPVVEVEDITIELDANGSASLNADALDMMIQDNCTPEEFQLSQEAFSCENLGSNSLMITVTDASGNSGSAEFNVTVVDNVAPQIQGAQIVTVCEASRLGYSEITATDNCSAELVIVEGLVPVDVNTPGEYMVEAQATDPSGNVATQTIMVIVQPAAQVDLGEDVQVEIDDIVTLVAGENSNNEYLWSTGETTPSISFMAQENVTISVNVTTAEGCTSGDVINVELINPLGVDEDENGNSVRFFPNPTPGNLSLELGLNKAVTNLQITIMDISGKAIDQKMIPAAQNRQVINLDLSQAAKGIYLVNVKADELNLTERVVKQ